MQTNPLTFNERVGAALKDENLKQALSKLNHGWVEKRRNTVAQLPEFEQMREKAAVLKDHILDHLDGYLLQYESRVIALGGQVHWARDAEEAREIILNICKRVGAKTVTRGKSMVGEEIELTGALEAAGIRNVETDLGEYIVQLAKEPPSHIVFPTLHKTQAQITELFAKHHQKLGIEGRRESVADIVNEARQVLRQEFFRADVGITGANYLVAESGSNIICTNEGNGDLTASVPRVHIVTSGIERVVPTLEDATLFLRLLARSATGQEITAYTTLFSGPRRPDDRDGPDEYHVVLVDNGRSRMLGSEFQSMLRCIRCGACMNHCPTYHAVGGHSYGWVYPGPMGAVLTPLIQGLEGSYDLPNACTLNGRCREVCPVKIPLNDLLWKLRRKQYEKGLTPPRMWLWLKLWGWMARHPLIYHKFEILGARLLNLWAGKRGSIRRLPLADGWTSVRDFPAPQGDTFLNAWQKQQASHARNQERKA